MVATFIYLFLFLSYTQPSTLHLGDAATGAAGLTMSSGKLEVLRQLPPQFDATGIEVTQGMAASQDGTLVPYFLVRKPPTADAAGKRPTQATMLYG